MQNLSLGASDPSWGCKFMRGVMGRAPSSVHAGAEPMHGRGSKGEALKLKHLAFRRSTFLKFGNAENHTYLCCEVSQ